MCKVLNIGWVFMNLSLLIQVVNYLVGKIAIIVETVVLLTMIHLFVYFAYLNITYMTLLQTQMILLIHTTYVCQTVDLGF